MDDQLLQLLGSLAAILALAAIAWALKLGQGPVVTHVDDLAACEEPCHATPTVNPREQAEVLSEGRK